MATKDLVTKVWIEDGCIVCDACETAAPDVFEVLEDSCIVRPAALVADFTQPRTESIIDAAEECPVDVIKFDVVAAEVADDAPAESGAEPVPAAAGASSETADVAPTVSATPAETPGSTSPTTAPPATAAPAIPAKTPAQTPARVSATAAAASAAKTSVAGAPDPAIAALLRAAATRGGHAGILRGSETMPEGAEHWKNKDPKELPPDARQSRVMEAAMKASKDPDKGRRAATGSVALAVGWVAFGGGVGISIGPAFARFMMPNVLEEPDPRVRVGPIKTYIEMAPGDVNEDYKPQGIWMIREEGRIAALNIICTHLGCIPNWLPNDRKFKCPCHGSGYKPDGINFEGPTPRPLERFRLSVEGGEVVVEKSKKYQYELGQWDQSGSFIAV